MNRGWWSAVSCCPARDFPTCQRPSVRRTIGVEMDTDGTGDEGRAERLLSKLQHQPYVFRVPIYPGHHPLVRQLDQIITSGHLKPTDICTAAGVERQWISRMRSEGRMPNIGSFDAVLQVLGYRLAIVKSVSAF